MTYGTDLHNFVAFGVVCMFLSYLEMVSVRGKAKLEKKFKSLAHLIEWVAKFFQNNLRNAAYEKRKGGMNLK